MRYRSMDMHVHSCHSVEAVPGVAGVTFSPKETPEELYHLAKSRGMDFVTITDHDTIDGCLTFLDAHPGAADFVVGEEVSTQLPASGLTVHLNVYGHSAVQHAELQRRRDDAFAVATFCRAEGLPFAWNHPFYRENMSTIETDEFMRFLAFAPVIEARNGGRMQLLNVLAEELAVREGKAVQGGSDSHTGGIGAVYTAVPCTTVRGFFDGILARRSRIVGQHSTPHDFLVNSFLAGRRHVIATAIRQARSPLQRVRMRTLGLVALLVSRRVVRQHFQGQLEMARIALAALPALRHCHRAVLEAA